MNAIELLEEVQSRGIRLSRDGEQLRVWPKRQVPAELVAQLVEHKAELLLLVPEHVGVRLTESLGGKVAADPSTVIGAEIASMRLDAFATAGLVVEVSSEVLGESVVFASDNALVDPGERRVVYRARELRLLLGLAVGELQSLHRTKKIFGATIEES